MTQSGLLKIPEPAPPENDAAWAYSLLGLASLLLQTVVLLQHNLGIWAVLPLLIGSAGILARWSIGPPLTLLCLTGFILMNYRFRPVGSVKLELALPEDVFLAGAMLAYVASAFRLQALAQHALPLEVGSLHRVMTLPADKQENAPSRSRAGEHVSLEELGSLLLQVAGFVAGASLVLLGLDDQTRFPPVPLNPSLWETTVIVWLTAVSVAVAQGIVNVRNSKRWSREEGLVALQDQLWRETRSEQTRLVSWVRQAELKRERRRRP